MESKKVKLRALYPLATPFQGIEMDDNSVFVKEKGVTRVVVFADILKIKVQCFSYAHRVPLLGMIQDVTLSLKSGEEVGLFNCKKSAVPYLIEKIKIQNQNVIVETVADPVRNYMAGFSAFNPIRDAKQSSVTEMNFGALGRSLVAILAIIFFIFLISLFIIKFIL